MGKKRALKPKPKNNTITLPLQMFAKNKTPLTEYSKAVKSVMRTIKIHFQNPKHGWPLDYSFLVSDIFYIAHGHHLEDYLLKAIAKSKLRLELSSGNGPLNYGLMLKKLKTDKKKQKRA